MKRKAPSEDEWPREFQELKSHELERLIQYHMPTLFEYTLSLQGPRGFLRRRFPTGTALQAALGPAWQRLQEEYATDRQLVAQYEAQQHPQDQADAQSLLLAARVLGGARVWSTPGEEYVTLHATDTPLQGEAVLSDGIRVTVDLRLTKIGPLDWSRSARRIQFAQLQATQPRPVEILFRTAGAQEYIRMGRRIQVMQQQQEGSLGDVMATVLPIVAAYALE